MKGWPFADPQDVAVFTTARIISNQSPILRVSHDEDDGAWQFHTGDDVTADEGKIVSLKQIVDLDASVLELAQLPLGWIATRETPASQWKVSESEDERD